MCCLPKGKAEGGEEEEVEVEIVEVEVAEFGVAGAEVTRVAAPVFLTREAEFACLPAADRASRRSVVNHRATVRLPSVVPILGVNPVRQHLPLSGFVHQAIWEMPSPGGMDLASISDPTTATQVAQECEAMAVSVNHGPDRIIPTSAVAPSPGTLSTSTIAS